MLVNSENLNLKNVGAYHAVSLFSNCGAGDVGYKKAGFSFDVMAELNPKRLDVCLLNHPGAVGVVGDLRETWTEVVQAYKFKTKSAPLSLLAACPPCQGMSSARGLRGSHNDADAGSKDKRNLLAVIIAKVALELDPKMIVVENVPEFLTKKVRHPETNEPVTASNLLIELLSDKYKVFPIVLDMCDFGIPQSRKRSFLTFIRLKQLGLKRLLHEDNAPYPKLQGRPINISEALNSYSLPQLDASTIESSICNDQRFPYHFVPVFSKEKYDMVKAIPPMSGKSAWTNNTCLSCGFINSDKDVICNQCDSILPKPVVQDKGGNVRLIKGFKTSYKRMPADRPAPTVLTTSATISSHNTIHPFENRVLSILECMKFQTFDDDFEWGETMKNWGPISIRKMIGEAVPPKFTQLHGNALVSILKGQPHSLLAANDKRCILAANKLRQSKTSTNSTFSQELEAL